MEPDRRVGPDTQSYETASMPKNKAEPNKNKTKARANLFIFLTGALCLSAGRGVLRLTRLSRHDRSPPYPGGIDPRLAVYARS